MANALPRRFGTLPRILFVGAVAAGAVAVYVTVDATGNRADAACAAASATTARLDPLARGHIAAFRTASNPVVLSDLAFEDAEGQPLTLADFAGRTVLLNLWATWCIPCREEMPALDALAVAKAASPFEVVAVSVDMIDVPARPRAFLENDIRPAALELYLDPDYGLLPAIREHGLFGAVPTTILVDGAGCMLGVLEGPADWASPEAQALIDAALAV